MGIFTSYKECCGRGRTIEDVSEHLELLKNETSSFMETHINIVYSHHRRLDVNQIAKTWLVA